MKKIIVGIDASNAKLGGAITHLTGVINNIEINNKKVSKIIVWGSLSVLDKIQESSIIEKRSIKYVGKYPLMRFFWWIFKFNKEVNQSCDILLNIGGTFFGSFRPYVTMSRNMLVFDSTESKRYGFRFHRFRYFLLRLTQSYTFLNATGIIFISNYAKKIITDKLNFQRRKVMIELINHGVTKQFENVNKSIKYLQGKEIRVLYISTIDEYKHQWNLIEAVSKLLNQYNIKIDFIGGIGSKESRKRFNYYRKKFDKENKFVNYHGMLNHDEISKFYKKSDIFVYLSTCENMPSILIEAMSSGTPIICSNYDPMPEFCENGALYVDPLSVVDIRDKIKRLIDNTDLRKNLSEVSINNSMKYNWNKCSKETFEFLYNVYEEFHKNQIDK